MKKITLFYLESCGYCQKAERALKELTEQNPAYGEIEITRIEESRQPEVADRYDYWAVPTFYVGDRKVFEAHIGMSYEDIRAEVKNALDLALD